MTQKELFVPSWILSEIEKSEADSCLRVRGCSPKKTITQSASNYKYPFVMLEKFCGKEKLKSLKILEVGSGNGFSLCYALKQGLNIVGIEPELGDGFNNRRNVAIKLLKLNYIPDAESKILNATAENLPFEDNTFDVVINVAVLEHVQSIDKSMSEMIRVLKPNGFLWANIPNYDSIYEGHYNIFWIPSMSKSIAKKYVKGIFNRDPYFIDGLNFTMPEIFRKYLKGNYGDIYLYGKWFNSIFTAYNYCKNEKLIPTECYGIQGEIISLFRHKSFRLVAKIPLFICVIVLNILGLATVFDLILYKKGV